MALTSSSHPWYWVNNDQNHLISTNYGDINQINLDDNKCTVAMFNNCDEIRLDDRSGQCLDNENADYMSLVVNTMYSQYLI